MLTREFWAAAAERAVRTVAQTLLALWAGDGLGVLDADWGRSASVAGMAGLLSLLTSLAATRVGERGTPSLLPAAAEEDWR